MNIIDAGEAREKIYGGNLELSTLHMPIGHLIPIMQDASNNYMTYKGRRLNQHPCDAWVYQEIIYETQPEVIIELGGGEGGSCLWLRDIHNNLVDAAQFIVSVDLEHKEKTENVITISGNSESTETINKVKELLKYAKTVMVIDDCAHTFDNVTKNLELYGPLVTKGCYYIVEDTIISNGLYKSCDKTGQDNPLTAVAAFLSTNSDFEIDRSREKFFITACPNGYLRRVK